MDNRLRRYPDRRKVPSDILDVDIPELARGLAAVARGNARVFGVKVQNHRYVQIVGTGINTIVPNNAWRKLMPSLKESTFSTFIFPVESGFKTFDNVTRFKAETIDIHDPLYNRALRYLYELFPTKVPT